MQKLEHLEKKIERLELLEDSHMTLERVFSKRFSQEYDASLQEEQKLVKELNHTLAEFRDEIERLRRQQ